MPNDPVVDRDRVEAMLTLGAPTSLVAERLGCTPRHVRRIRQERNAEPTALDFTGCWTEEWEKEIVWDTLAELGYSDSRIAYLVGRTRQAVHQWRKKNRPEPGEAQQKSADPDAWQGTPVDTPQK